jgi:hypothetical protein
MVVLSVLRGAGPGEGSDRCGAIGFDHRRPLLQEAGRRVDFLQLFGGPWVLERMKTFWKVTLLLGVMVVVLLALPGLASTLFGGFFSGMAALALLAVGSVLFLGLAIVGGGTAAVVAFAVLLALGCVVLAVLLPVVLPILIVAGLITLVVKLVRLATRPRSVVVA